MAKNLKIVFLDRITAGPIELRERFSKYGEYIEYEDTDADQIVERISDVDVVITNRIKLRKEHFEKAPKLKLVLITATGFNHIDIESGNEKGIKIANVSDYSTNSVAQLAITYLLNELTPITEYSKEVKNNKWLDITIPEFQSYPINDAEGKILGIVGFGNIGKKVAAIAEVLGMVAKIPGRNYDENKSQNIHEKRYDLDEVLEKCDILTLHTPLTELTRDLINLERMKKNIERMKKDKLPYNEKMEVNISERNVKIRKKWDIIRRIAAITMTRLAAETYLEKKENGQKELETIIDIFEKRYQFKQVLTEREKNYLENPSDDKELNVEFYFMLEAAKMLLWVLSVIDIEFDDFNIFCDISILTDGLKYDNLKSFARKCEIRSQNKILDMLDYIYRLNWANVEIKLEGYDGIVNESILYFSRLALEWVVQDGKSIEEIIIHT